MRYNKTVSPNEFLEITASYQKSIADKSSQISVYFSITIRFQILLFANINYDFIVSATLWVITQRFYGLFVEHYCRYILGFMKRNTFFPVGFDWSNEMEGWQVSTGKKFFCCSESESQYAIKTPNITSLSMYSYLTWFYA
jgi:hypothetical protein